MSIGASDEPFVPGAPPLRVLVDRAEARVAARGELDAATAPRLRVALDEVLSDVRSGAVVVDLSQVESMATDGVEVLIEARSATKEHGRELVVRVLPDGPVARTLRHAGFDTRLGVTIVDVEAVE